MKKMDNKTGAGAAAAPAVASYNKRGCMEEE